MSNFWQRTLFGALFVLIMVTAILYSEYTFLAILVLINVLGLKELYTLEDHAAIHPQKYLGILCSLVLFLVLTKNYIHLFEIPGSFLFLPIPFIYLVFFVELYKKSAQPFINIAYTLLPLVYITVPLCLFFRIAFQPDDAAGNTELYHSSIIIGYFIILWSHDTGAYLAGRKFGKHKLFERISPKKTWEGSIGGTIVAFIAASIISRSYDDLTMVNWMVITAIIIVTGTLGDLVESMFKRSINIKDSGNVIPGHGGILDRFDALFLSTPFVFMYLQLVH